MTEDARKIVGFRGCRAYAPGEPIEEVVGILERALGEAKSGNIRAVAVAYAIVSDTSTPMLSDDFYAEVGRGRDLYMSLGRLVRKIERWIDA